MVVDVDGGADSDDATFDYNKHPTLHCLQQLLQHNKQTTTIITIIVADLQ